MKLVFSLLTLAVSVSMFSLAPVKAAEVVDSYTSGNYKYTCIMVGSAKMCGNWNVVSG